MTLMMRGYAVGQYEFTIDGLDTFTVKSVEGGLAKGNTIEEQIGPHNEYIKHLSTVEIDPMSVELSLQDSMPVLKWIRESWQRKYSRKHGSIKHANFDQKESLLQVFTGALLTEVTFPTFDATSKEAANLKLKIQAETVELKAGDSTMVQAAAFKNVKLWSCAAFRLVLDQFPSSSTLMVTKIDSFTVKQGVKPVHTGKDRFPHYEPTKLSFPDLSVHMSLALAGPLIDWYKAFVIGGAKDPDEEHSGAIEYLSPDRKTVVFRIKLAQVGIKAMTIDKSEKTDSAKKVKFDLYVGAMDIDMDSFAFTANDTKK